MTGAAARGKRLGGVGHEPGVGRLEGIARFDEHVLARCHGSSCVRRSAPLRLVIALEHPLDDHADTRGVREPLLLARPHAFHGAAQRRVGDRA